MLDLSKHKCMNVSACGKVMEQGWKNRATGATLMNAESSRSHSIFTIYMERCETDEKGKQHIRAAKLNLVDLAGSERQSKTGKIFILRLSYFGFQQLVNQLFFRNFYRRR